MAIVHSSNGEFRIDPQTGAVLEWEPERGCDEVTAQDYGEITRFDLDEYFQHYSNEKRDSIDEFDILDLGYWCKSGAYEPPEADWRKYIMSQGPGVILR